VIGYGIIATLQVGRGAQLMPVSAPIAFPVKSLGDVKFGRIADGHPGYRDYRAHLKRTIEEPFALFLPG
jgi:hypothetical protein